MKRRLFHKIGLCVVVLFSLCGMAVVVGRRQAEPTTIPGLKLCGEMLCYLGILPGTTAWDEGMNIIRQTPQLRASGLSDKLFLSVEPRYSVGFSPTLRGEADPNDGVVEEIKINIGEENIYAGFFIRKFGFPCYIQTMNGGLGLGYPNAILVVVSDSHWLTPESPIRFIVLRSPRVGPACAQAQSTGPSVFHKWDGFGRYF